MTILERFDNRRYPPTRWARFVVDPEKCNGCKKCVDTCPGQMLELEGKLPVNRHPLAAGDMGCIGCKNCYSVCPEDAIEIRDYYRVERGFYKTLLDPPSLPNPLGADEAPAFEAIEEQLTETERVIYKRRSNRLFKKKAVPEALLARVVEAGRFAPSAGNNQPWRFVVVTDKERMRRIAEGVEKRISPLAKLYLRGKNGNGSSSRREALKTLAVNLAARLSPNNLHQVLAHGIDTIVSNEHYELFLNAPALIVVLGDKRGISEPLLDCGLAAHNMVLAAHSLGLGTCYIGFTKMVNGQPELERELGIEWPYKVMTSLVIGYPRTRIDKAVPRERAPVTWYRADRTGPTRS